MNKKIKQRWIKALLSGKYKQGRNRLKTYDGRYCCLGVLCDLHRLEYNKTHKNKIKWGDDRTYLDAYLILPIKVSRWARTFCNPEINCTPLAEYNDGNEVSGTKKHSFKQIAALIEKHL